MFKGIAVIAGAMAGAVVMTAAPAHADQYDFISALDQHGVVYDNISDMINVGKLICHTMRSGGYLGNINKALDHTLGYTSQDERGIIVVSAANTMCPDIWPVLNAQAHADDTPPPPPPADPMA